MLETAEFVAETVGSSLVTMVKLTGVVAVAPSESVAVMV